MGRVDRMIERRLARAEARVRELEAERDRLQAFVLRLADRVYGQAQLLSACAKRRDRAAENRKGT